MRSRARLFVRLSLAHVRCHRARFAATTLGIALAVASLTGVLALTRSIVRTFEDTVTRTAGKAQLQVSGATGVERALVDVVAAIAGVETASGNVQLNLYAPALGRRLTIFGFEIGRDDAYREAQVGRGALQIDDSFEFLARLDSVALSTSILAERGWGPGDTLEVLGPRGPRTLTIRGGVRPDGALRIFGGDVAVMDADAAQRAFGTPDRFDWLDVVVRPEAAVAEVERAVAQAIGDRAHVGTPVARGRRIQSMLHLMRVLLAGMAAIAGLVALFLIQHAVAMSVRQRQRDIALLKALGLSRTLLVTHLLGEWAVVGVVASGLGVLGGVAFWAVATGPWSTAMATFFPTTAVPALALAPGELGVVLAVGIVTAVGAALGPSVAALRLRPIGTLCPAPPAAPRAACFLPAAGVLLVVLGVGAAYATYGRGDTGQILAIGAMGGAIFAGVTLLVPSVLGLLTPVARPLAARAWGVLGGWSWQQVRRHRMHAATTVGSLAAGVTYALAITVTLGTYRLEFLEWFDQTFPSDVIVYAGSSYRLLGPLLDVEAQQAIAGVAGVARVLPQRVLETEFRGRPIFVQGTAEPLLAKMHPGFIRTDPNDVVVSDSFAERFGVQVGDHFTLPAPVPLAVRVAGIVPEFTLDLGLVKVAWPAFVQHYHDARATLLLLDAVPGVDPRELKARVEGTLAGRIDGSAMTMGEMRDMIYRLVNQTLAAVSWLQLLAGFVAVVATIHATAASIMDRSRDLSTWRALGLTAGRLRALLVGEAGLLAALGATLGVASGSFAGYLLVQVVAPAVAGYHMQTRWPWSTMLELFAMATAAGVVTARLVATRRLGARDVATLAARL